MNDFANPPADAAADPAAAYEAAMKGAQSAETPQMRAKFVDQMEILARQLPAAGAALAVDPTTGQAPDAGTAAEGFEGPTSGLAYHFEQVVPPGLDIARTEELGAMKSALAEIGVPADIAQGGFADVARLISQDAFATPAAETEAVFTCRDQLVHVHGEEAALKIINDGIEYIRSAVQRQPALAMAGAAAMASPMALFAAAQMKRFGKK